MQTSGLFLSRHDLSRLSPSTQEEIQHLVFELAPSASDAIGSETVVPPSSSDGIEGPPDLSPAQARKLIAGCSERPTKALRFIADQPTSKFPYSDMLNAVGTDSSGTIRGSLAAITRRTRTVLGDSSADLIWYEGEDVSDWVGSVSEMTHSSLRKAFGIA
jgi:hypothetical protein